MVNWVTSPVDSSSKPDERTRTESESRGSDMAETKACRIGAANTFSILDAPDERQNLILAKGPLSETVAEFRVYCPQVALFCEPGQFVVVRGDEKAERLPLTIADFDRDEGSITLVVQIVGVGTRKLDRFEEGDRFVDVVGDHEQRQVGG